VGKIRKFLGSIFTNDLIGSVRYGLHCEYCKRELADGEVHIVYVSEGGGDVNTFGKARCKVCETSASWDGTDCGSSLVGEAYFKRTI
jgi:hypothetical protein